MDDWRIRLGAKLLVERAQKKDWNVAKASRRTGVSEGVIKRIERGENYEIESLEKYVAVYGRPLESWIREVLTIPDDLLERIAEWSRSESAARRTAQETPIEFQDRRVGHDRRRVRRKFKGPDMRTGEDRRRSNTLERELVHDRKT